MNFVEGEEIREGVEGEEGVEIREGVEGVEGEEISADGKMINQ